MKKILLLSLIFSVVSACSYEDDSALDGNSTSIQAKESAKNRKARLKQPVFYADGAECMAYASPEDDPDPEHPKPWDPIECPR